MFSTRLVSAVVTETGAKNVGLAGSKNGWADSFHLWVVDSTQLERARSVLK